MYAIQAKPRINSKKFSKTIITFENENQVIDYLKLNNLIITEKPYFFTHLPLNNGQIITSFVKLANGEEIICSPEKLAKLLNL